MSTMGQMDEDQHCGASTEQASDPPAEPYVPAWLAPDGKRRTGLNLSFYRVHKDAEITGYGPATGFSELSYRRAEGREDDLRKEINRQVRAGRRNRSRFIMRIGSSVTPETPVNQVRQYCDIAREVGS